MKQAIVWLKNPIMLGGKLTSIIAATMEDIAGDTVTVSFNAGAVQMNLAAEAVIFGNSVEDYTVFVDDVDGFANLIS